MNAPIERRPGHVPDTGTPYRPLGWRRRVLIALLAVVTAYAVVSTLLDPPGGVRRQHLQRVDAPRCRAGQVDDCVGGKVDVRPEPAASTATR